MKGVKSQTSYRLVPLWCDRITCFSASWEKAIPKYRISRHVPRIRLFAGLLSPRQLYSAPDSNAE